MKTTPNATPIHQFLQRNKAILLLSLMLVGILWLCFSADPYESPTAEPSTPLRTDSAVETLDLGVSLTLESVTPTTLVINREQSGVALENGAVYYGSDYAIQRLSDGAWEYMPDLGYGVPTATNYPLKEGASDTITIDLERLYGAPFPVGTYCYAQEFQGTTASGEGGTVMYYVDFEITQ